jgi:uncharacterized membrane protein
MDDRIPHRFVFVLGLLFGGVLVFLTPPYSVPDELAHFHRAYHCSQGKLYACKRGGQSGDDLPKSLIETYVVITDQAKNDAQYEISWAKINKASRIALDSERQRFTVFSNTVLYSPLPYLPQAAAIFAGRLWGPAPLALLYMGRVANLIAYLFLAAAAVRLMPIQKWTLAMVALMPMSVYLAASLSADAMTIGLSLLVIALTLNLALGSARPDRRSLLALGFLLVALSLSKQAYLGLAVLFLVIPGEKFSSPGRRRLIAGLMIGVPLAIDAAWMYSLRGLYVPILPFVDPPAQLRWIFANPWSYAAAVIKALYHLNDYSLMIGVFGWLGPHLPRWIRDTYWVALGLTAVLDGGKPLRLGYTAKIAAFGAYACTAVVMATFVYLSWERVGIKSIEGIQPRYFLPIIPLLLLLPRGSEKLVSSRFSRAAVPTIAILITILAAGCTCWTLVKRYYW